MEEEKKEEAGAVEIEFEGGEEGDEKPDPVKAEIEKLKAELKEKDTKYASLEGKLEVLAQAKPETGREEDPSAGAKALLDSAKKEETKLREAYKKAKAKGDDWDDAFDAYEDAKDRRREAEEKYKEAKAGASALNEQAQFAQKTAAMAEEMYKEHAGGVFDTLDKDEQTDAVSIVQIFAGVLAHQGYDAKKCLKQFFALAEKGAFGGRKSEKKPAPDVTTASERKVTVKGAPPQTFEDVAKLNQKLHKK